MQLNFKKTVAALGEYSENQGIQGSGQLNQIIVHFPPGCSALVDVRVFLNSEQILPNLGYLALDDATPTFSFAKVIRMGDNLRVEMVNTDDTYPHTISVIANIV